MIIMSLISIIQLRVETPISPANAVLLGLLKHENRRCKLSEIRIGIKLLALNEFLIPTRAKRFSADPTIVAVKQAIPYIRLHNIDPRRPFSPFLERIREKNKCGKPGKILPSFLDLLVKEHSLLRVSRLGVPAAS